MNSWPGRTKASSPIVIRRGRPDVRAIIASDTLTPTGEVAMVCCGPRSLQDEVRRGVLRERDVRGLATGQKSGDVYLHLEGFSY